MTNQVQRSSSQPLYYSPPNIWEDCSPEQAQFFKQNLSTLTRIKATGHISLVQLIGFQSYKEIFTHADQFIHLLKSGYTPLELLSVDNGNLLNFFRHPQELNWLYLMGASKERLLSIKEDLLLLLYQKRDFLIGTNGNDLCAFSKVEFVYFVENLNSLKETIFPLIPQSDFLKLYPHKGHLIAQNRGTFRTFMEMGLTLSQINQFSYEDLQSFFTLFTESGEVELKSRLHQLQGFRDSPNPDSLGSPCAESPISDVDINAISLSISTAFTAFYFSKKVKIFVGESLNLGEFSTNILKIPFYFRPWFYRNPEQLTKIAKANITDQCFERLRNEPEYALIKTPHGHDAIKFPDAFFNSDLVTHFKILDYSPTRKSIILNYAEEYLALCQTLQENPESFQENLSDDILRLLVINYKAVQKLPKPRAVMSKSFKEAADMIGVDAKHHRVYCHNTSSFSPSLLKVLHKLSGLSWACTEEMKRKIPFILENYDELIKLALAGVDIHFLLYQFPRYHIELMLYNPRKIIGLKDRLQNLVGRESSLLRTLFFNPII